MNNESIFLLNSLKGFLINSHPDPFNGNWGQLIALANSHSVTGILGYMVMSYPDIADAQMVSFMRQQCLGTIGRFSRRAEDMRRLMKKMDELEIDHLVFKGFVLREYYPLPELRTFGDVDFLIRPEDRKKSDALMMQEGFERKNDWEPVYSYIRGSEFYEVHTDVMEVDVSDKADYKGYFQRIWEHAHRVSGHTWELSREYHLLYLLTHIAKHISGSGAGIRMYLDIAVFLRHFGNELDWDFVCRELETLCFRDFANMVFTVAEKYFGVENPVPLRSIETQVVEDFMEFTMAGGTFGHMGRDSGVIALKTQDRNEETVSRGRTFLRRLFAPAEDLEKRYTYLQGRHYLLPIVWVHRFFKTKDSWGAHAREAKSIMNADVEEVLKLKRIYREIGLGD